jgi:hypothetical protein
MTFDWKVPPWLRPEDTTHMAVTLTPIQVAAGDKEGEFNIAVDSGGAEVTAFSADDTRDLLARLQAEYGAK